MLCNLKMLVLATVLVQEIPAAGERITFPVADPANDQARMLAGMPPLADPALIELSRTAAWQSHATAFHAAWAALEKNQLSKVRSWAAMQMADACASSSTAYYMFSGPDFLYANAFFPRATTYIMCGVEPIGPLPDLTKIAPGTLGGELRDLRESLDSVLNFSFFITKEMKSDLQNHKLSGTLPVIYLFLARSEKTICDIRYVGINQDGIIGERSERSTAPGVRIDFLSRGAENPQTLYYFSTDISDDGLKSSGFLKFCQTLAPGNSCVKSASYLMHEKSFATIRAFLLDHSRVLVQDDSGIPCGFFAEENWNLQFFGRYLGPIPLFRQYTQAKLAQYYQAAQPGPLDFGIGYRHRLGESTLMVARRKTAAGPVAGEAPPVAIPRAVVVPDEPAVPAS